MAPALPPVRPAVAVYVLPFLAGEGLRQRAPRLPADVGCRL